MRRPRVTLKLATSLDGRIATATGESRWITGEAARAHVHELRAAHDAILVGIGTVLADDPALTVRIAGYGGPQPLRVVLDSQLRTPPSARIATSRTLIVTTAEPRATGEAEVHVVPRSATGQTDIVSVLGLLAQRGIERLMIEGGGQVAAAFVVAGLVDQLYWYRAPVLLGADGRPAIASLALENLAAAPKFRTVQSIALAPDRLDVFERA